MSIDIINQYAIENSQLRLALQEHQLVIILLMAQLGEPTSRLDKMVLRVTPSSRKIAERIESITWKFSNPAKATTHGGLTLTAKLMEGT